MWSIASSLWAVPLCVIHRRNVGCCILYACYSGVTWLLYALCKLNPLCGWLQPTCIMLRHYVGCCVHYVERHWRRQVTKKGTDKKEGKHETKTVKKTGNQDYDPRLRMKNREYETKNTEIKIKKNLRGFRFFF